MPSILARLGPSDIRTDPFPHIVADDVLPPDIYAALSESFPAFARIAFACTPEHMPSNRRFAMPAQIIIDAPDLPPCWKAFAARHSGPDFLAEVAALFRGHWAEAMLDALGGGFDGHDCGLLSLWAPGPFAIHQDARIEINSPVRDRPSISRGPHLDTPERLFSGLFYMRAPDDDSVGGELILYRWKQGPIARTGGYDLPEDAVEPVAVIPYAANRLVIFPQSIDALHGVGLRHPTPHDRRYVFLTAELAAPWLVSPAAC